MREQLQALVNEWIVAAITSCGDSEGQMLEQCRSDIESILAASQPHVGIKTGWMFKDNFGLFWCREKPRWSGRAWLTGSVMSWCVLDSVCITDPWETSHPNGGPECIMEVKP